MACCRDVEKLAQNTVEKGFIAEFKGERSGLDMDIWLVALGSYMTIFLVFIFSFV